MLSRSAVGVARRWATVLLTIAAWIVLSNHCVLGLAGPVANSDSKTDGCPMHSAPAKGKPAANIPCCKDLRAVTTCVAKNLAAEARQLVGAQDYVAAVFVIPPQVALRTACLDTGPPQTPVSFAESVLQRSLLAHAPPAAFSRV